MVGFSFSISPGKPVKTTTKQHLDRPLKLHGRWDSVTFVACQLTKIHFLSHFFDYLVSLLEFNCFTQSRLVTFKARLYLSLPEQKSISEILKVLGRICLPRYTVLNCKGNLTTIRPSNKIVALTGCSQGNLCLFLTEQSLF